MGESACVMQPLPVIPTEGIQGDPLHGLNDSVSFGRFAPESLSWEKWSTFSHKKYVEEAERYSKPGSVAEKKAFFEAHYKKKASMKTAGLLEQSNNTGQDSVAVSPKSQEDTGNGELKDQAQKDDTLSDGGVKEGNLASKKEEEDTRKDEGSGGFAPKNTNLSEQGRNPHKQKLDAQMETLPSKDLAGSLPSSTLDGPPQKKRTSFLKFMGGSRSRPKTNETASKRKKDKAESKRSSWSRCFCFGTEQLEDRPKPTTDKVAAASTTTTAMNGGKSNNQQQRLESRGLSTSLG